MTEHHTYVPTGNPRWRTCAVCGHGANTSIHRPPYGRGEVDDAIALLHRTSADLDASVRAYCDDDDLEPDANDLLKRDLWDADHG